MKLQSILLKKFTLRNCLILLVIAILFLLVGCASSQGTAQDDETQISSNTAEKASGDNSLPTEENLANDSENITFEDVSDDTAWYYNAVYNAVEHHLMSGYEESNLFGADDALTQEQLAMALYHFKNDVAIDYSESDNEENTSDNFNSTDYFEKDGASEPAFDPTSESSHENSAVEETPDHAAHYQTKTFVDFAWADESSNNEQTDANNWAKESELFSFPNQTNGNTAFDPNAEVSWEQLFYTLANMLTTDEVLDLASTSDLYKTVCSDEIDDWAQTSLSWAVGAKLIDGLYATVPYETLQPMKIITRKEAACILCNAYTDISSGSVYNTYTVTWDAIDDATGSWETIHNLIDDTVSIGREYLNWTYKIDLAADPIIEHIECSVNDSEKIFSAEEWVIELAREDNLESYALSIITGDEIISHGLNFSFYAPSLSDKEIHAHASFELK